MADDAHECEAARGSRATSRCSQLPPTFNASRCSCRAKIERAQTLLAGETCRAHVARVRSLHSGPRTPPASAELEASPPVVLRVPAPVADSERSRRSRKARKTPASSRWLLFFDAAWRANVLTADERPRTTPSGATTNAPRGMPTPHDERSTRNAPRRTPHAHAHAHAYDRRPASALSMRAWRSGGSAWRRRVQRGV